MLLLLPNNVHALLHRSSNERFCPTNQLNRNVTSRLPSLPTFRAQYTFIGKKYFEYRQNTYNYSPSLLFVTQTGSGKAWPNSHSPVTLPRTLARERKEAGNE